MRNKKRLIAWLLVFTMVFTMFFSDPSIAYAVNIFDTGDVTTTEQVSEDATSTQAATSEDAPAVEEQTTEEVGKTNSEVATEDAGVKTETSTSQTYQDLETLIKSIATGDPQALYEVLVLSADGELTIETLIDYVENKGLALDDWSLGLSCEGITLEDLKAYQEKGYTLEDACEDYAAKKNPQNAATADDGKTNSDETGEDPFATGEDEIGEQVGANKYGTIPYAKSANKYKKIYSVKFNQQYKWDDSDVSREAQGALFGVYKTTWTWRTMMTSSDDTDNTYRVYCLDYGKTGNDSASADYTRIKSTDSQYPTNAQIKELKDLSYFTKVTRADNSNYDTQMFYQFMVWQIMEDSGALMMAMSSSGDYNERCFDYRSAYVITAQMYDNLDKALDTLENLIVNHTTYISDTYKDSKSNRQNLAKNLRKLILCYNIWKASSDYQKNAATYRSNTSLAIYKNASAAYQRMIAYDATSVDRSVTFKKIESNEDNGQQITISGASTVAGTAKYGVYTASSCSSDSKIGEFNVTNGTGTYKIPWRMAKSSTNGYLYIKEISAPPGYQLDTKTYKIGAWEISGHTYYLGEKPIMSGIITATKWDKATAQKLAGAVIELQEWSESQGKYVAVGILDETSAGTFEWKAVHESAASLLHEVQDGRVYYTKDNQGKFRLVEKYAPRGYDLFDGELQILLEQNNQTFDFNTLALGFSDDEISLPLEVEKRDSVKNTLLTDATIKLYEYSVAAGDYVERGALKDLGTGVYSTVGMTVTSTTEGITATGELKITDDNRGGTFKIKETSAPANYILGDEEKTVTLDTYFTQNGSRGDDSTDKISFSGANAFFNTPIGITVDLLKTDSLTQKEVVAGATFTVYEWSVIENDYKATPLGTMQQVVQDNVATNQYALSNMYYTQDNLGMFKVVETKAPNGYLKDSNEYFVEIDNSLTEDYTYDTTNKLLKVAPNKTGRLSNNDNETFDNTPKTIKGIAIKKNEKDKVLEGAEIGLYAGEDIYDSNKIDLLYAKDALIASQITDKDGKVSFEIKDIKGDCSLYLKEIAAPLYYSVNPAQYPVEVIFEDDDEPVFEFTSVTIVDEIAPMKVRVYKTDKGTQIPLKGVEFTVYDKDGNAVEVITSDETGNAISKNMYDLYTYDEEGNVVPTGYTVKETKAIDGYVIDDTYYEMQVVEKEWSSEDAMTYICMENGTTYVEISKTSLTTGAEIKGALLTLYNSDNLVVASWVTDGTPVILAALPPGEYRLVEERAPFGYIVSEDVTFTVTATEEIQKVEMKDSEAYGKLIIQKHDKDDSELPLEGVEFEIRNEQGDVIETLITDENGYAESSELPFATFGPDGAYENVITYKLVETKTIDGYLLDDTVYDIQFNYIDDLTPVIELTGDIGNKKKPETPKEDTPGTGESGFFIVLLAILLISGTGIIVYFIHRRRQFNKMLGR